MVIRAALGATLGATLVITLAACGQRGALYIPGKPGDPYFDRQQRGSTGTNPGPSTVPNSNSPGNAPNLPPGGGPRREDGTSS